MSHDQSNDNGRSVTDELNELISEANQLQEEGRIEESESAYRKAVEIAECNLGSDHPDLATCLNCLALLLCSTDRIAEAEPVFKRVLKIRESVLEPDDLDLAVSFSNLGFVFFETNRYAEAEPLLKRAIEIRERVLGVDHPYLATNLDQLADILEKTGRGTEAVSIRTRMIKISMNSEDTGNDSPRPPAILIRILEWLSDLMVRMTRR